MMSTIREMVHGVACRFRRRYSDGGAAVDRAGRGRKLQGLVCLMAATVLGAGSLVHAAILTVMQDGSGNFTTIQAAINAASNGDTILIGPGSYPEFLNSNGKSLTLRGINGFTQTIVDPNGVNGTLMTVAGGTLLIEQLSFRNGRNASMVTITAGAVVTFDACRFLGGLAAEGAALAIADSTATFTGVQFLSNQASSRGGAVKADNSTLAFTGCTFSTNQCTGTEGGVLRLLNCTVAIGSSTFTGNSTTGGGTSVGGAIWSSGGGGVWSGNTFSGNWVNSTGTTQGGDLYLTGAATPSIVGTSFSGSRAIDGTALGGSILLTGSARPTIIESTFTDCQAQSNGTARGGAIYIDANCNIPLRSVAFALCRVPNGPGTDEGGAIYVTGASPLIDDCVFAECSSNDGGGAIFLANLASPTILSSRFEENSGSAGGAIAAVGQSSPLIAGTFFSGNTASGSNGGGVHVSESAPSFAGCLFQQNGNRAIAVFGSAGYVPLIGGSTFCGNGGGDVGGPWFNKGGNVFTTVCGGDCNENGLADIYEIATGLAVDCNKNGVLDQCEIAANPPLDCNGNGILDQCESGSFSDCDGSGVPDSCKPDCNANGIPDPCEVLAGLGTDCNGDGILDACAIAAGTATDCDGSGLPDECKPDCDRNGVPDVCQIAANPALDCSGDGVLDSCQVAADPSLDVNRNGVLDSCEGLNLTGIEIEIVPITGVLRTPATQLPLSAVCYRIYATFDDPGARLLAVYGSPQDGPMVFTTAVGFYQHPIGGNIASLRPCDPAGLNPSLAYDSFLTVGGDCIGNSSEEAIGINFAGFNAGNTLLVPDGIVFVDLDGAQGFPSQNGRVLVAQLTTRSGALPQGQFNLAGFNADGSEFRALGMTWGPPPLVDCNGNGQQDAVDIGLGISRDCNRDGIPDECQTDDPLRDCNGNGIPDWCDIAAGTSPDLDGNGIPDECQCQGDVDGDGVVDVYDLIEVIVAWGETGPNAADLNGDGVVDAADLTLVLSGFGACL